jgi:hypothetical protein
MTSKTNKRLLEVQTARVMAKGVIFTADDITEDGQVTLDGGAHRPNHVQNGIGAFIQSLARRQLIVWTGEVATSASPRRKGGIIKVWRPTTAGMSWARGIMASR